MTINFFNCNKEYYFKDILVFTGTSEFDKKYDETEINKKFCKYCRDKNFLEMREYWKLSNKELLDGMLIKNLEKPKTFPKFSNENSFKILHFKSYSYSPKIIAIRWTGYEWEYQLEKIGHKTDYQSEDKLMKI